MNKAAAVIWRDDFNAKSYKIVLPAYGLKCLKESPTSEFEEKEIVVYGPTENVDKFLEDLEDYNFEILDVNAERFDDDDAYKAWLDEVIDNFETCAQMCSEMDGLIAFAH